MTFGDIQIRNEMIHVTASGKRLWITHGDLFDSVMQYAKWLAYLGDSAYTFILFINKLFNDIRIKLGLQYWSLSQFLKHKVKNAVSFIADFEAIMAREARKRKCDGVVCGHIHKAEIRDIDGLLYCNDGDWVESLTALVETFDGELKIIHWPHILQESTEQKVEPIVISSFNGFPITSTSASEALSSLETNTSTELALEVNES
jgi:UDP-2,3-diacylglucosamine pyrophosphatase LpxH